MTEHAHSPSAPAAPTATAAEPASAAVDHLAALAKMSTTAGLGSGDYAAVSPLAVASVIVGVLGATSYFTEFLLPVPAAAVVVGLLALRQIARSNGTLTGREWAFSGIGLGVLVLLLVGGGRVLAYYGTRADREKIEATLAGFDREVMAKDYEKAYGRLTPEFQARVTPSQFVATLSGLNTDPEAGPLLGIRWNGKVEFPPEQAEGARRIVLVGIHIVNEKRKDSPGFIPAQMEQRPDGQWYIRDLGQLFPVPRGRNAGGGGAGGAGGR